MIDCSSVRVWQWIRHVISLFAVAFIAAANTGMHVIARGDNYFKLCS